MPPNYSNSTRTPDLRKIMKSSSCLRRIRHLNHVVALAALSYSGDQYHQAYVFALSSTPGPRRYSLRGDSPFTILWKMAPCVFIAESVVTLLGFAAGGTKNELCGSDTYKCGEESPCYSCRQRVYDSAKLRFSHPTYPGGVL